MQLVDEYDGKRPPSLDLFLEFVGLTEDEFLEIAMSHQCQPHVHDPARREPERRTTDFDRWSRDGAMARIDAERIVSHVARSEGRAASRNADESRRPSRLAGVVDYGAGNIQLDRQCSRPTSARQLGELVGSRSSPAARTGAAGCGRLRLLCRATARERSRDRLLADGRSQDRLPMLGICVGMQLMARRVARSLGHQQWSRLDWRWLVQHLPRPAPSESRMSAGTPCDFE